MREETRLAIQPRRHMPKATSDRRYVHLVIAKAWLNRGCGRDCALIWPREPGKLLKTILITVIARSVSDYAITSLLNRLYSRGYFPVLAMTQKLLINSASDRQLLREHASL